MYKKLAFTALFLAANLALATSAAIPQTRWEHVVGYRMTYFWSDVGGMETYSVTARDFVLRVSGPSFVPHGVYPPATTMHGNMRRADVSLSAPVPTDDPAAAAQACHAFNRSVKVRPGDGLVQLIIDLRHDEYHLDVGDVRIHSGCWRGTGVGGFRTTGRLNGITDICGTSTLAENPDPGAPRERFHADFRLVPLLDDHSLAPARLDCPQHVRWGT